MSTTLDTDSLKALQEQLTTLQEQLAEALQARAEAEAKAGAETKAEAEILPTWEGTYNLVRDVANKQLEGNAWRMVPFGTTLTADMRIDWALVRDFKEVQHHPDAESFADAELYLARNPPGYHSAKDFTAVTLGRAQSGGLDSEGDVIFAYRREPQTLTTATVKDAAKRLQRECRRSLDEGSGVESSLLAALLMLAKALAD